MRLSVWQAIKRSRKGMRLMLRRYRRLGGITTVLWAKRVTSKRLQRRSRRGGRFEFRLR